MGLWNCPSPVTVESPFCYEVSIAIKLLDTIITKINHINIPRLICTNSYGTLELSVTSTSRSPFCYEVSIAIKLLDTIITSIYYVYIVYFIYGNICRIYKLSVTSTSRSPFCYEVSIAIKLLDTIILSIISYIDIPFGINANSTRIYKLSIR